MSPYKPVVGVPGAPGATAIDDTDAAALLAVQTGGVLYGSGPGTVITDVSSLKWDTGAGALVLGGSKVLRMVSGLGVSTVDLGGAIYGGAWEALAVNFPSNPLSQLLITPHGPNGPCYRALKHFFYADTGMEFERNGAVGSPFQMSAFAPQDTVNFTPFQWDYPTGVSAHILQCQSAVESRLWEVTSGAFNKYLGIFNSGKMQFYVAPWYTEFFPTATDLRVRGGATGGVSNATCLVVEGTATQGVVDLQQWLDSFATKRAWVGYNGSLNGSVISASSQGTVKGVLAAATLVNTANAADMDGTETALVVKQAPYVNNLLGTYAAGWPYGLASDGTNIWVSDGNNHDIEKHLAATGALVATVATPHSCSGVCFDGTFIWVCNHNTDQVTKINPATDAVVGSYTVGTTPVAVCYDAATGTIWTANDGSDNVTKLDAATGAVIGTYSVGDRPDCIVSDGTNIWVGNYNDFTVTKLLAATGALVGTYAMPATGSPAGICFDGTCIWVTSIITWEVRRFLASNGTIVGTYNTGQNPRGVCFDGTNIWIGNYGASTVTKLDGATGGLLGTFVTGTNPYAVCAGPVNTVWTGNYTTQNLSKFDAAVAPVPVDAGRIVVGTEQDWVTPSAGTQDAYMEFVTALDGVLTKQARIWSNGDVEALVGGAGFILKSPDSTRWRIVVSNAGVVSAVPA